MRYLLLIFIDIKLLSNTRLPFIYFTFLLHWLCTWSVIKFDYMVNIYYWPFMSCCLLLLYHVNGFISMIKVGKTTKNRSISISVIIWAYVQCTILYIVVIILYYMHVCTLYYLHCILIILYSYNNNFNSIKAITIIFFRVEYLITNLIQSLRVSS